MNTDPDPKHSQKTCMRLRHVSGYVQYNVVGDVCYDMFFKQRGDLIPFLYRVRIL
jgi:hypothetical protein